MGIDDAVNISEVKRYLSEHPPETDKEIVEDGSKVTGLLGHIRHFLKIPGQGSGYGTKDGTNRVKIASRIAEALPKEGDIVLYDNETRVVFFDGDTHRFIKARWSMKKGFFVTTDPEAVSLEGYRPASHLSVAYFDGGGGGEFSAGIGCIGMGSIAASALLETILALSPEGGVLEVGDHEGDSNNRYLAFRTYEPQTKK